MVKQSRQPLLSNSLKACWYIVFFCTKSTCTPDNTETFYILSNLILARDVYYITDLQLLYSFDQYVQATLGKEGFSLVSWSAGNTETRL